MKSASVFLFSFVSFVCGATVGFSQTKLTAAALNDWQKNGFSELGRNEGALNLPAGGEISRSFGGMVAVHLISHPHFSGDNSDLPIFLVGPVALVFRKEEDHGQLVLADSVGKLQKIGGAIALDATGFSDQSVDVLLAYDPQSGLGFIGVGDELQSFQFGYSLPSDAALSSGSDHLWILESLDVNLLDDGKTGASSGTSIPVTAKSTSLMSQPNQLSPAVQKFLAQQTFKVVPTAFSQTALLQPTKKKNSEVTFEISTPPSVRNMSPEALRALVAKSAKP